MIGEQILAALFVVSVIGWALYLMIGNENEHSGKDRDSKSE